MTTLTATMQCPNSSCLYEENPVGQSVCMRCGLPLTYRYLGVVGDGVGQLTLGSTVGFSDSVADSKGDRPANGAGRYLVISPQIWLDTQPSLLPERPEVLSEAALPYLHLYPYQLHVPLLYGVYSKQQILGPQTPEGQAQQREVLLLENTPVDAQGKSLPTLVSALRGATSNRQVYWLWQLLDLWAPLSATGVASSLLIFGNLRVDGWRVRLRSLFLDSASATPPTLKDLAALWLSWKDEFHPSVAAALQPICAQMETADHSPESLKAISHSLNQLLLQQTAEHPVRVAIASATSTGPQRSQNEDALYPTPQSEASPASTVTIDPLMPRVAIICDGIGGHAGGEVASQMSIRSLQLQMRAFLTEIAQQTEPLPPEVIAQQLEAMVRVVNNLIATQNDTQGREARQRMGTTLVMALQICQRLAGVENQPVVNSDAERTAHELYLVHVGDSRAYWLTADSCCLLTVDDDLAGREVSAGRLSRLEAAQHPGGGALTQAVGTRDAEALYPTVQRFIVDEDGVLLLCSDGLSDNDRVEATWQEPTRLLLQGTLSPAAAAEAWVALADEQNGHDNASAVVMLCRTATPAPKLFEPPPPAPSAANDAFTGGDSASSAELSEAGRALLYDDAPESSDVEFTAASEKSSSNRGLVVGVLVLLLTFGVACIAVWQYLNPQGFQRFWQRQPAPEQPSDQG